MDTLENRLQKRIHVSLYALSFLMTLLGLSLLLEGCTDKCEVTHEYIYLEPVFTPLQEIRASVELTAPQPIAAVGKIYFKDDYLYVNEPGKGIHIIDNSNPSSPLPVKFLAIPGNFDLAIKGNTLYADSYVDLVAFDVSSVSGIHEVARLEGILKQYSVFGWEIDENCCVITSFEEKKVVSMNNGADCASGGFNTWMMYESGILASADKAGSFYSAAAIAPGSGSGSGVGGSMARFTISGEHLYLLDGGNIQTVDVSNETSPVEKTRTPVSWDIETIFPYKSNLFLGSQTGMYIMDISSPESPVQISRYQHVTSCDPVVVDDRYAYVTLRTENTCARGVNELQVIDISDLASPTLVKSYSMSNPHGLGIDDATLFICDGDAGLKAFDATNILQIDQHLLAHYDGIHAYDVIPFNDVLMMIGKDGIFQYDYSDPNDIRMLSKINLANAL